MRLKNKKTGEINYGDLHLDDFDSLAELNEEWEDYEEPEDKDFWFFDEEGIIRNTKEENWPEESVAAAKAIGDYFETKEEAERAVEKLKAWKRLKDKGFTFYDWVWDYIPIQTLKITASSAIHYGIEEDLDLLFGGEE